MNLRQLEVFLAILDHGSFSAGARACLISQSTASQAIATLEEELGARLLERAHGGVSATPAGKAFKKHARQILADVANAVESVERQRGLAKTTLVVAASTIPCAYLIPPVLKNLIMEVPDLKVTLLAGDSQETVARVVDREADIGIVGSKFEERGLVYEPFHRDAIKLYAAAGSGAPGSVSLAELRAMPMIVREAGSGTAKSVGEALAAAGVDAESLPARLRVGSSEAAKAAMLIGLGATFLSELAVAREVERGDAAEVVIREFSISRTFYLVRRLGSEGTGACLAFREAMLSHASR